MWCCFWTALFLQSYNNGYVEPMNFSFVYLAKILPAFIWVKKKQLETQKYRKFLNVQSQSRPFTFDFSFTGNDFSTVTTQLVSIS